MSDFIKVNTKFCSWVALKSAIMLLHIPRDDKYSLYLTSLPHEGWGRDFVDITKEEYDRLCKELGVE